MSGNVSRLFAADREADIEYTKALKAQYGHEFDQYRYRVADHNRATEAAWRAKTDAFRRWHRAALGRR